MLPDLYLWYSLCQLTSQKDKFDYSYPLYLLPITLMKQASSTNLCSQTRICGSPCVSTLHKRIILTTVIPYTTHNFNETGIINKLMLPDSYLWYSLCQHTSQKDNFDHSYPLYLLPITLMKQASSTNLCSQTRICGTPCVSTLHKRIILTTVIPYISYP